MYEIISFQIALKERRIILTAGTPYLTVSIILQNGIDSFLP